MAVCAAVARVLRARLAAASAHLRRACAACAPAPDLDLLRPRRKVRLSVSTECAYEDIRLLFCLARQLVNVISLWISVWRWLAQTVQQSLLLQEDYPAGTQPVDRAALEYGAVLNAWIPTLLRELQHVAHLLQPLPQAGGLLPVLAVGVLQSMQVGLLFV